MKINEVQTTLEYADNIIDTLREPFVVLNDHLEVISANLSFYESFKVDNKETIGKSIFNLGNGQWNIPKLKKLLKNILPQKSIVTNYEIEHTFEYIGRKIMQLNAKQLIRKKGEEKLILIAIEDITELKNAQEKSTTAFQQLQATEQQLRAAFQQLQATEQQLRAAFQQLQSTEQQLRATNQQLKASNLQLGLSEKRYRLLFDLLPYGGEVLDKQGLIINCSASTAKMLGYKTDELIGMHITKLVDPDYMLDFKNKFPILLNGEPQTVEIKMLRKDGTKLDILRAAQPLLDSNGQVESILALNLDISKRKRYEEELIRAKEKAEESDRLKSAFLANMSHEIRTPMNGILGFANLLNDPELNNADRQEYSSIINKNSERLLNTINDLIDISKIEAGQMEVSKTETSVDNLLEELHSFFKPEAGTKGLSLKSSPKLTHEKATVLTDETKLHSILSNLIKNAIKYTEKGNISFGYNTKTISETVMLEFFVQDTGIGIPEKRQHAVFNRFEQADIEDKRAFEGSGLGLAIAKAYVEMLGGKIWLTSEVGKGSTFMFTIPYETKVGQEIESVTKKQQN